MLHLEGKAVPLLLLWVSSKAQARSQLIESQPDLVSIALETPEPPLIVVRSQVQIVHVC
jgi:hypothetical protein